MIEMLSRQRAAINRARTTDEAGLGRLHEERDSLPTRQYRSVILNEVKDLLS